MGTRNLSIFAIGRGSAEVPLYIHTCYRCFGGFGFVVWGVVDGLWVGCGWLCCCFFVFVLVVGVWCLVVGCLVPGCGGYMCGRLVDPSNCFYGGF